jgi:hypothetical protein
MGFTQALEHRARQDKRADFRQDNDQDPAHRGRRRFAAAQTKEESDDPAQRRTEHAVDPALASGTQQDTRISEPFSRNHQGLGNDPIGGASRKPTDGRIRRRMRLGGLLNYCLARRVMEPHDQVDASRLSDGTFRGQQKWSVLAVLYA